MTYHKKSDGKKQHGGFNTEKIVLNRPDKVVNASIYGPVWV